MLKYGCGCEQVGEVIVPFCPIHGDPLNGWREGVKLRGIFTAQVYDVDGSLVHQENSANTVTIPGITDLLTVGFAAGTQKASWFFGLIDNTSFSSIASSDTASSHSGWIESTTYSEATRQSWSPSVASAVASNGTPATFTSSGSITIKGAFIVSNSTKGGTGGQLWSAGTFAANQILTSGQTLKLTYSLTGA